MLPFFWQVAFWFLCPLAEQRNRLLPRLPPQKRRSYLRKSLWTSGSGLPGMVFCRRTQGIRTAPLLGPSFVPCSGRLFPCMTRAGCRRGRRRLLMRRRKKCGGTAAWWHCCLGQRPWGWLPLTHWPETIWGIRRPGVGGGHHGLSPLRLGHPH